MPAHGPPRLRGSPTLRGSAAPEQAGPWALLASPLPTLRRSPQPRSPGAFPTVPSPCIFTGGQKSTAERATPAPPRRRGVPRIFPNFSWGQIHLRAQGQPPVSQAGTSRGTGGRSHKTGRFAPPRETLFGGAGRGRTWSRRRCCGSSRSGSRGPAGSGLLRPLRSRRMQPGFGPLAGGIGNPRKSFPSRFPSCILLKSNEKLFRPMGFVALAKRRRPGRPGARSPLHPPRRDRSLPAPRAPSPAE